jgi:hypothetical protein
MPEPIITVTVGPEDRGGPLCDFCGQPGPVWLYPAHEFSIVVGVRSERGVEEEIEQSFDGQWTACAPCADLIERGDRAARVALTAYAVSLQTFEGNDAAHIEQMIGMLAEIHRQFLLHRNGPRRPYSATSAS